MSSFRDLQLKTDPELMKFDDWEWGEELPNADALHNLIDALVVGRMRVIFGENGLKPQVWLRAEEDGSAEMEVAFLDQGCETFASATFDFFEFLDEFVDYLVDEVGACPARVVATKLRAVADKIEDGSKS